MPSSRDEIQRQTQQEPVGNTRNGRRKLVRMSAHHYDWLVAAARRSHRTIEAMPVVVDAVRQAKMDVGCTQLDELLK